MNPYDYIIAVGAGSLGSWKLVTFTALQLVTLFAVAREAYLLYKDEE